MKSKLRISSIESLYVSDKSLDSDFEWRDQYTTGWWIFKTIHPSGFYESYSDHRFEYDTIKNDKRYVIIDSEVYLRPRVIIYTKSKSKHIKYFDSYQDALDWYNHAEYQQGGIFCEID